MRCMLSFLLLAFVAQAERHDVVQWLVWSRANPAKPSGHPVMKMPEDPGQTDTLFFSTAVVASSRDGRTTTTTMTLRAWG